MTEYEKQMKRFYKAGGMVEVCSPRKLKGSKTFSGKAANSAPAFLSSPPPMGPTTSSVFRRYS